MTSGTAVHFNEDVEIKPFYRSVAGAAGKRAIDELELGSL